ncbi:MAG: heme-binding protein [Alphaproteobacteria bacterium]|nr:heme-binding protein [Alphaproteobacteria bacterium]
MSNLADKKALTLTAARAIVAAAETEARNHNLAVTMSVVDEGGHLLHLARMDETGLASVEVSIAKARAAVMFKRPTKFWEDAYASGRTHLANLPGVLPIEGGVPLMADGKVIGALGVSGASSAQDGQVAAAGAAALGG